MKTHKSAISTLLLQSVLDRLLQRHRMTLLPSQVGHCTKKPLSLWRKLDLQRGVAAAMGNLGMVSYDQGDYPAAMARREESLAIWRELGDQPGIARTLMALGNVVYSQVANWRLNRCTSRAWRSSANLGTNGPSPSC